MNQQAAARYRRKRRRGQQFGVVIAPSAFESLRPPVVKDIFPLRVPFDVQRHHAERLSRLIQCFQMLWIPALTPMRRATILERGQPTVRQKRVKRPILADSFRCGTRIPQCCIDLGNAVE